MRDISEIIRHAIGEHFKEIKTDEAAQIDRAARGVRYELIRIDNIIENINEAARFFGEKKIQASSACMRIDDMEWYGDDIWDFCFYPNSGKFMSCHIYMHQNDIHSMIRKYLKLNETITIEEILKEKEIE